MAAWLTLVLFGAACCLLIADGLRSRSAFLQFPFLAGCGLFGFLFLQAVGVVRNSEMAPPSGLVKALVLCTLCTLAVYFGWRRPPSPHWIRPATTAVSPHLLYWIGLVCLAIGLAGFVKLTGLTGGFLRYYSVEGGYTLEWRGLPVAYSFFTFQLQPGLVLTTLAAIRLRSAIRLIPPAIVVVIELADIFLAGRRTSLVWLATLVACVLFFSRKITPPRALIVVSAPALMLAMFLVPEYRKHSQIGGDREKIREISVPATTRSVLSGIPSEFWAMTYLVDITDKEKLFQFGLGFYNRFIADFVPKLIVGEETKQSLFVRLPTAEPGANEYGWEMPYGMVPTGPASVFSQFWYFGCLCFYFLARAMRYFWTRAVCGGDLWAQAIYAFSVAHAVAAVVNDMYAIYLPLFMFILPVGAALWLLRPPHPRGLAPARLPRMHAAHRSAYAPNAARPAQTGLPRSPEIP